MDKEMLKIFNDLSKKPTTELALQIMELASENIILEKLVKKQKEVIDKAIEWVRDWTYDANDWFEEDSKPSELLDILKEVSK